jgi:hypothetical protein
MYEIGQKVLVITDKGVTYDATVLAIARGDGGPGAYKVALNDRGPDQLGQWHKAADVFILDQTMQEKKDSWDKFLKE